MRRGTLGLALPLMLLAGSSAAQVAEPEPAPTPMPASGPEFRFGGEVKIDLRNSKDLETPVFFPFPAGLLPPGTRVVMRTVDPGSSLELQNLALRAEGEIASGISAKLELHVLDLYNRNPTSSDDRVLLREAWVRFGEAPEPLGAPGTHAYALVGVAPRFTKQLVRHLESYGMWGTAVGRFEQPQVQLGARLGPHAYVKGLVGNGNPVFFRDTNALAGDNGTPERAPGNVNPIYQSGLPILYDAKPADLNPNGKFEWGAGLGARWGAQDTAGLDALGWYFARRLADSARIRGTFYGGDLKLLQGFGFPLPVSGRDKREWGVNLQGRAKGWRFFGQYVDQHIAGLPRRGFEAELAWIRPLNALFLIKESPFLNWVQPVVRVSYIDNLFTGPRQYPALSVLWDWTIYNLGVRVGLVQGTDLTIEYARHDAVTRVGVIHPDETLVTLRVGF